MRFKSTYGFLVLILMLSWKNLSCNGSDEAFGFTIHHRSSDPVKALFNGDDQLPEKGSFDYYAAMFHRDRVFHRRRLAGEGGDDTALTFATGNTTFRLDALGFLYYANVTVGTPESWFLVALDTGSHLFWLPCDCVPNCLTQLEEATPPVDLNIYSLRTSSTGNQVTCTSPYCTNSITCDPSRVNCPYQVRYLSANTSSTGYLVEDVLHLATNSNSSTLNARIPFGCGVVQTGSFLTGAAANGLLGLTRDAVSLPTVLANQNLTTNSYSMCFSEDGLGNIIFGDRDGNKHGETPLDPDDPLDLYSVSIAQISMGTNNFARSFAAIIDTGTSFTHLADPAYTFISETFDSQINDPRLELDPDNPLRFCYASNLSPEDLIIPNINLTMAGGDIFTVTDPALIIPVESGQSVYCLAVFESGPDEQFINIIGENFLSGYRIVFDHERMVLGWKDHDCGDLVPLSPRPSLYNAPTSGATRPTPGTPPAFGGSPPALGGAPQALGHSYFICILLIQIIFIQQISEL